MVNTIDTVGIVVNAIRPEKNSNGNMTNSCIELEFNSDLKVETLFDSVKLFKNLTIDNTTDNILNRKDLFKEIEGSISYINRTLKFTPNIPLENNSVYNIYIKENSIKDINNKTMLIPFVSSFSTGNKKIIEPPIITYPSSNATMSNLKYINISSNSISKYKVQISSKNDFTILVYDEEHIPKSKNHNNITIELKEFYYNENNYYIRVSDVEDDVFSESVQVEIRDNIENIFENEDNEFQDDSIPAKSYSYKECFPIKDSINISIKINHLYCVFDGKISESDIKSFTLSCEPFTEEDEYIDDVLNESYIELVYDDIKDKTTIYYKFKNESNDNVKNYGEIENLYTNMLYKARLELIDNDIEWYFTSTITPKYCTVNQIRAEGGEFVLNIKDIDILKKIHVYSVEGTELYEGEIEEGKVSRELKRWVKYKTLIDLCNTAYLNIAKNTGSETKSIGDISISKSYRLPYLSEILKKFKEELNDVEDAINEDSKFTSSPRAGSNSYPLNTRVGF